MRPVLTKTNPRVEGFQEIGSEANLPLSVFILTDSLFKMLTFIMLYIP